MIAFEPYPPVYATLCENLRLNDLDWVQTERKAVSDEEGELQMRSEANHPLSFTAQLSERGDLIVPVISIDRYVESARLKRLDFVKVDVEGAEDAVIRGIAATLRTLKSVVLVEIHADNNMRENILILFQQAGSQLSQLYPHGWMPRNGKLWEVLSEFVR